MDSRLKNTVMCSFLLIRRQLITLAVIEAAALVIAVNGGWCWGALIFLNDILPLMYLFFCGMKMFENHTPFCISNAVSLKNRIISLTAAAVTMCLFTSVFEYTVRYVRMLSLEADKIATRASAGSIVRHLIHANDMSRGAVLLDVPEMLAIGLAVFSLGYFIAGVRFSKGGGFALTVVFFTALFMGGSVLLSIFLGINFLKYLFIPPAYALINRGTSAAFMTLLAAAMTAGAIRLSLAPGENS